MAAFVEEYIQEHQAGPFFVYYPLTLPHDPWIEAPGYPSTGNVSGDLRAFYGPRENTVGATGA
jgi:hypothetical protein